jgi:hypothetical protein
MPRPPIDLPRKIKDILRHVQPLPPEAGAPLSHHQRTSTDIWNLVQYVEKTFDIAKDKLYQGVAQRHLGRLNEMILVNLIETFERFLKEIAAKCVDHLAPFILDDRFSVFSIQGSGLASHFGTATLGKSLCESSIWLDCDDINKRFRTLLSDPFQQGGTFFHLFPKAQQEPAAERWRYDVLSLLWQLRHTAVHNVGVITQSDAVKLRLWAKEPVASPQVLLPTRDDIRYLKRFLDETAVNCNRRIGERLAALLTTLHSEDPSLFVAQEMSNTVSQTFGLSLTVAGAVGVVPAP